MRRCAFEKRIKTTDAFHPFSLANLPVLMKRIFFIFSYERAQEMRKIAVYRSLLSYLVPELQSVEVTKMKAKSEDMKHGNQ